MLFVSLGLLLGVFIGFVCPLFIPASQAKLFSVALLAALDSVFGGLRASTENKFDNAIFMSGFFINALLAAALVFLGDFFGMDMYFVAMFVFGMRIFQNLAIIRRYLLKKYFP